MMRAPGAKRRRANASAPCRLRPFTEEKQRAADFKPVATFEHASATNRLTIDQDQPTSGGAYHEVLALVADYRVMSEYGLIAEESDVALLGAADDRDRLGQRIFAAFARVAALAAHYHQPTLLEQFADQSDEEADKGAEDYDSEGAAECLREGLGDQLVAESAGRTTDQSANGAVAKPRTRAGGRADPDANRDTRDRPSEDTDAGTAVEDIKGEFRDQQPEGAADGTDDRAGLDSAQRLPPLAYAEGLDRSEKGRDEKSDERAERDIANPDAANAEKRLRGTPCAEPA